MDNETPDTAADNNPIKESESQAAMQEEDNPNSENQISEELNA